MLGDLRNNGGATPAHALAPESPVVDSRDQSYCLTLDQREELRDDACDIGAFEFIDGIVMSNFETAP